MQSYRLKTNIFLISTLFILAACGTAAQTQDISGTYLLDMNDCEDDGGDLTITQEGSDLTFDGGFDSAPSPYFGTLDSDGNIAFTNGDGECEAIIDDEGAFSGICHYPAEDCEFSYSAPI